MRVGLWGTRGSIPSAGPETIRYGGNTSCVEVQAAPDHVIVLDAGSGMRRLGEAVPLQTVRVDILLTHLHMDHIMGLGFFDPLFRPDLEVHIWAPSSAAYDLRARLSRYLNPPLFPVRIPDLPSRVELHDVPLGSFDLPGATVTADLVLHPGVAVGYRIDDGAKVVSYLPDHEPVLGSPGLSDDPTWLSGYELCQGADLLIHDAQYTPEQYRDRVGWGHSSIPDALRFAEIVGAAHFVPFHHDPSHSDYDLDRLWREGSASAPALRVTPAREGQVFDLNAA